MIENLIGKKFNRLSVTNFYDVDKKRTFTLDLQV